jgi:hypothetical protein
MPKHIFSQPGAWDDAIKGKAVGSGPYRQTAHHPKSNTTFEAFADYNGPRKPAFKRMNWLTIVDAAPRVARISGPTRGRRSRTGSSPEASASVSLSRGPWRSTRTWWSRTNRRAPWTCRSARRSSISCWT